ncbi:MAG: hypothetical protein ACYTF9_10185, partial [Planctomycetota bacterium]
DRIEAVRQIFAPTRSEQVDLDFDAQVAREREAARVQDDADRLDPPMSSETTLRQRARLAELERHTSDRLSKVSEQLMDELEAQRRDIELEKQTLAADRAAWEADIEAERLQKTDEQFQQTVKLYESVPSKQAKQLLLNLVDAGQIDQAVTYLDAMAGRPAAGVIKALKSDAESKVATELLERLRTHGLGAVARDANNDDSALSQPASADAAPLPGAQTR